MGKINFFVKMLKLDIKTCIAYVLSLSIGFVILFNVFNLFFLEEIKAENGEDRIFFGGMVLIITAIILLLGYYSNSFFLSRRGREVGVELVSGLSLVDLSVSFIVQNTILSGLATLIGVIGGILVSPIFNTLAFNLIGISGEKFYIAQDGIICTVMVIIIQILFVAAFDVGYGHRSEICDLIKSKNKGYKPKKKIYQLLKQLYILLCLLYL